MTAIVKDSLIQIEAVLDPYIAAGCRVFSVTGSGGKTTFIRRAALHYGAGLSVGVAASTKMCVPDEEWCLNGMIPQVLQLGSAKACGRQEIESAGRGAGMQEDPGICFYTDEILPEGKLHGLGRAMCRMACESSRILLIEADGSNRKPLKGWREDEPVILPETDVTIGILPMHCLGQVIDDAMVHRMAAFTAITGLGAGNVMSADGYRRLILHPEGLFRRAVGQRILVLNRVDNSERQRAAEWLSKGCGDFVHQVVTGCLREDL